MSPVLQYLLQSTATLLGVVLLLGLIVFATRRLSVAAPQPGLELLARLPLEARRAVYVVRVKQRVFVLAGNDHAMTKLAELAVDEFPDTEPVLRGAFGDALRRALSGAPRMQSGRAPKQSSGSPTQTTTDAKPETLPDEQAPKA